MTFFYPKLEAYLNFWMTRVVLLDEVVYAYDEPFQKTALIAKNPAANFEIVSSFFDPKQ